MNTVYSIYELKLILTKYNILYCKLLIIICLFVIEFYFLSKGTLRYTNKNNAGVILLFLKALLVSDT